ncbi:hypothetical protein [Methanolobus sp. ZRKC5]|uniref:hypothetical protein n=1 Tax=unclassified Methanolobus TaxID=2629569 RepID=UPI00313CBD2A
MEFEEIKTDDIKLKMTLSSSELREIQNWRDELMESIPPENKFGGLVNMLTNILIATDAE